MAWADARDTVVLFPQVRARVGAFYVYVYVRVMFFFCALLFVWLVVCLFPYLCDLVLLDLAWIVEGD